MKNEATILVTGAAGHVGANLVHRLLDEKKSVRVLLRRDSNNDAMKGLEVERMYGDLRDYSSVEQALSGCSHAFHVAAKVSTLQGTEEHRREIFDSNVIGTKNVLKAAKATKVERIVVTGSFSAVGHDPDDPAKPMAETSPFFPYSQHLPYARSKMLVEHECLKAAVDGLDVVIATSCAVLGPNDHKPSRMGRTLMDYTHGKLRAYVPGGFEFVASRDIVSGHILAMEKGRTGHKYTFSTEYQTIDQILDHFEAVTGVKRPSLRLSPTVMGAFASVASAVLTRFAPSFPQRLTPGAIRILRMQRHADISKAKDELGYEPTSVRRAIAEAYADFAKRGLVPERPENDAFLESTASNNQPNGARSPIAAQA